jgi:hypothetical protein
VPIHLPLRAFAGESYLLALNGSFCVNLR